MIYINAGHFDEDSGAVEGSVKESEVAMQLRDLLQAKLMDRAVYVPDNLNLKDSIAWVNERAQPDDIAIDIHLNSNGNQNVRGVEAYYVHDDSLAKVFSRQIALATDIPDRGARLDSETFVGSLGWLRYLKCKSVLIEVCYMTNPADLRMILSPSGKNKVVNGILNAIRLSSTNLETRISAIESQIKGILDTLVFIISYFIGKNK